MGARGAVEATPVELAQTITKEQDKQGQGSGNQGELEVAAENQRLALAVEWQTRVDNPKLARDYGGLGGFLRLKMKVAKKADVVEEGRGRDRAPCKVPWRHTLKQ